MRHAINFLAVFSLSVGVDSAIAEDGGWYIGIGFGDVTAGYEMTDFADGSVTEGVVDNSDSSTDAGKPRHRTTKPGILELYRNADRPC